MKKLGAVFCLLTLSACGEGSIFQGLFSPLSPSGSGSGNRPTNSPTITACSGLSFANVNWAPNLSANDHAALEIALNISGSYEGDTAWANLTNDFDGEGLSMGLLNQTLGTGSLQPLLIQMRDSNLAVLQRIFEPTRLQSLLQMLSTWQSSNPSYLQLTASGKFPQMALSGLDIQPLNRFLDPHTVSPDQASVNWALANLYTDNGVTFDPTWASNLQAMAQDPTYVSIQIDAALDLHDQALSEETLTGVTELRSYLFMFDVNVQDGGMYDQDWTDYATWQTSNPGSTDTAKLDELLTLRLRHVKSQYVHDVTSRKQTIIDGSGVVHGVQRNLETQYCFNRLSVYPH